MPYVRRDNQGTVKGVFNRSNPEALEFLPIDDSEVIAYLNPPSKSPPTDSQRAQDEINNSPAIKAIVRTLANDKGITEQQMIDQIKARA